MYTLLGTFDQQKKSKKKKFARFELAFDEFYIGPDREDMFPASEAKGFLLVDKKDRQTSFYLDTNGNGKLNKKKDLLITTDGFEKALYKSKKGSLHATNSQEAMIDALTGLIGGPPPEELNFEIETGLIVTNKKGKTIDFLPLEPGGEGLSPIMCMMNPQLVQESEEMFERWQNRCAETGFELV